MARGAWAGQSPVLGLVGQDVYLTLCPRPEAPLQKTRRRLLSLSSPSPPTHVGHSPPFAHFSPKMAAKAFNSCDAKRLPLPKMAAAVFHSCAQRLPFLNMAAVAFNSRDACPSPTWLPAQAAPPPLPVTKMARSASPRPRVGTRSEGQGGPDVGSLRVGGAGCPDVPVAAAAAAAAVATVVGSSPGRAEQLGPTWLPRRP